LATGETPVLRVVIMRDLSDRIPFSASQDSWGTQLLRDFELNLSIAKLEAATELLDAEVSKQKRKLARQERQIKKLKAKMARHNR
jgi:hypothetical protein